MNEPLNLIEPKHAFVLHSGGVDSTTALFTAAIMHDVEDIVSVGIDYGQRHSIEMDCADVTAKMLGCRRIKIKIPDIAGCMLTDESIKVPHISYDDIEGVSPTYVPFRNGLLISTVVSLAHATAKEEGAAVYLGNHAEDALNSAYPDCSFEFTGSMAAAILVGTYNQVRLRTPFQWMTKADIVSLGHAYGVPFEHTHSCYVGTEKHCGLCPTCLARKDAFKLARITDPTVYEG